MRNPLLRSIALALYAMVALYCTLSLFVGPAGFPSYRNLSAQWETMNKNLEKLKINQAQLKNEIKAIKENPERIQLEARELGYLAEGEQSFIIAGAYRTNTFDKYSAGSVISLSDTGGMSDSAIKRIALGFGILVLCLSIIFSFRIENPIRSRPASKKTTPPPSV